MQRTILRDISLKETISTIFEESLEREFYLECIEDELRKYLTHERLLLKRKKEKAQRAQKRKKDFVVKKRKAEIKARKLFIEQKKKSIAQKRANRIARKRAKHSSIIIK